ncbi:glycosyltransferase family 4 protein [Taibaiella soli]|nr:glycosyltransferase family 4 protein [Taibaiella soli]
MAASIGEQLEFILVLPTGSNAIEYVTAAGLKVYTIPMLEISKSLKSLNYLPRLWKNTKRLLQIIKEENIDVLHINDLYNMLGCTVKRKLPLFPVVYHARLLSTSYIATLYPYFVSMIKRYADKIICVSAAVEKDIHRSSKTDIIYDTVSIKGGEARKKGLEYPEYAQILYLANFVNGKGQQYAIHALKEILNEFPEVKLHFAGGTNSDADERFRQSLMNLARDLGINNSVIFEPKVSNIEGRIKQADIVLNLSESESFSMVTLETMACGVPLVVSDCGGPAEITDQGHYADLVPNRDAQAAAMAVKHILKNPDAAKERAKNGMNFVHEKFDPHITAKHMINIYTQIISKAGD